VPDCGVSIGFLHTADVHVATFTALVEELAPGRPVHHLVDERLLADARAAGGVTAAQAGGVTGVRAGGVTDARAGGVTDARAGGVTGVRAGGVTPELAARVRRRLRELADDGAELIVCTCSTIGAAAEEAAGALGVPVLRADRPMADAAVAAGPRIGVLVTSESTREPTLDLLRESAARAGADVTLTAVLVASAWQHFEAGELEPYHAEIAAAARQLAPTVDVVVLAQASMAPAAALIDGVPVLTSPRSAVRAAINQLP
jgi:Asp/Glu/hydantoin racemase